MQQHARERLLARVAKRGVADLVLWFNTSRREMERRFASVLKRMGEGGIWICWPKKTSGVASDLSEPVVRKAGLDRGIVDFKVAAIDATWSGLKFQRRKR